MDGVSRAALMANTEVLKEPRGFIKFIEIIIVIFAFATATSYYSSTAYNVKCINETESSEVRFNFQYPFRLDEQYFDVNLCQTTNRTGTRKHLYGDYSAASQFFVFVGVTAFLYCIGILIFYVFGDDKYRNVEMIPIVDFVVTAVYVLLWLISSSAWADAVMKIKMYTDPKDYFTNEYACECEHKASECVHAQNCIVTDGGNYSTINVSIVFGFLCMCVWAGNLWFLYKETKWHKSSNMPPSMPPQSTPDMQQQI